MFKIVTGLGAAMLMASTAAVANPAAPSEDKTKNADERVICQKEEAIGSRLAAKRICLTAREWKAREAENREQTERAQQSAGVRASN